MNEREYEVLEKMKKWESEIKSLLLIPKNSSSNNENASDLTSTSQDAFLMDQLAAKDPIVMEESVSKDWITMEKSATKDPIVMEESVSKDCIMMEKSATKDPIVMKESVSKDCIMMEKSATKDPIVMEESVSKDAIAMEKSATNDAYEMDESLSKDDFTVDESISQDGFVMDESEVTLDILTNVGPEDMENIDDECIETEEIDSQIESDSLTESVNVDKSNEETSNKKSKMQGKVNGGKKSQAKKVKTLDDIIAISEQNMIEISQKEENKVTFYCKACKLSYKNISHCSQHISQEPHYTRLKMKQDEAVLDSLPKPSAEHLSKLEEFLLQIISKYGASEQEICDASSFITRLQSIIKPVLPECKLSAYGSLVSKCILKTSDVNIDISVSDNSSVSKAMETVHSHLQKHDDEMVARSNFDSLHPNIQVEEIKSGRTYTISGGKEMWVKCSKLLWRYSQLDSRVTQLSVLHRYWFKVCGVDDPTTGTIPPYVSVLFTIYFLQCVEPPVLPHLPGHETDDFQWSSKNEDSFVVLWLQMLRFYALFDFSKFVISLNDVHMTADKKAWPVNSFKVEDPASLHNIMYMCRSKDLLSYLKKCYFISSKHFRRKTGHSVDTEQGNETEGSHVGTTVTDANDHFVFSFTTLTDGKGLSICCHECKKTGHTVLSCPEFIIPRDTSAPDPPNVCKSYISGVISKTKENLEMTPQNKEYRYFITAELERYIRYYHKGSSLTIFGSTCNGFGFCDSDLDLYISFDKEHSPKKDASQIVLQVSKTLRRNRMLTNIVCVRRARVPIVKFLIDDPNIPPALCLEADISFCNRVALENTKFLHTYSLIDERVVLLAYTLKRFAKVCNIGDASQGSLSSYAYIIMLIHFLQQTSPPILPVLQKLPNNDQRNVIDGIDVSFFKDISHLNTVWPLRGSNKSSVVDLWLGFLRYYTESFDVLHDVVTIRQHERLTKFEKLWNGLCIAIEDPFIRSHNLGGGLSCNMNKYILKTLRKAKRHFCQGVKQLPGSHGSWEEYYFDPTKLTEGDMPLDKRCRSCGKIGHMAMKCPNRRNITHTKKKMQDKKNISDDKKSNNVKKTSSIQSGKSNGKNEQDSGCDIKHQDTKAKIKSSSEISAQASDFKSPVDSQNNVPSGNNRKNRGSNKNVKSAPNYPQGHTYKHQNHNQAITSLSPNARNDSRALDLSRHGPRSPEYLARGSNYNNRNENSPRAGKSADSSPQTKYHKLDPQPSVRPRYPPGHFNNPRPIPKSAPVRNLLGGYHSSGPESPSSHFEQLTLRPNMPWLHQSNVQQPHIAVSPNMTPNNPRLSHSHHNRPRRLPSPRHPYS